MIRESFIKRNSMIGHKWCCITCQNFKPLDYSYALADGELHCFLERWIFSTHVYRIEAKMCLLLVSSHFINVAVSRQRHHFGEWNYHRRCIRGGPREPYGEEVRKIFKISTFFCSLAQKFCENWNFSNFLNLFWEGKFSPFPQNHQWG